MATELSLEGVDRVEDYFDRFPTIANKAARLAINTIATRQGLKLSKDAMQEEVAFPRGYLNDRLIATKKASSTDLEAIITGRKRATSLARFATGGQAPGVRRNRGVRIRVSKGRSSYMKSAFLVRLRRGASLTEDNYNVGLALRLKPGESIRNKKRAHLSWLVKDQVALLYGPSVDQVFRTVAAEVAPKISRELGNEFLRQFARLS